LETESTLSSPNANGIPALPAGRFFFEMSPPHRSPPTHNNMFFGGGDYPSSVTLAAGPPFCQKGPGVFFFLWEWAPAERAIPFCGPGGDVLFFSWFFQMYFFIRTLGYGFSSRAGRFARGGQKVGFLPLRAVGGENFLSVGPGLKCLGPQSGEKWPGRGRRKIRSPPPCLESPCEWRAKKKKKRRVPTSRVNAWGLRRKGAGRETWVRQKGSSQFALRAPIPLGPFFFNFFQRTEGET